MPIPDRAPDRAPADRRALIVGAGVAGLATATALARSGIAATVLEQAPMISEVGAGLQISPNGARVLAALGLSPESFGDATEAVELRDHRGALVTRLDLRGTPGFFLCHRADLIAALERAARAADVEIRLRQRIDDTALSPAGVSLTPSGGPPIEASLVIGADGVRSVLRGQLNTPAPPFFTGQVAWRATIAGDGGPAIAQVFMGPGRHLVSYPLRGGALRNIVAVREQPAWAAEGWHHRDDPDAVRTAFAGFGGPVPGWLAQLDEVYLWGLFRHPVAAHWHDGSGRAALAGDAAHPTLPFMAQGANLALEDAWTLARCLAQRPDDPARALAAYEVARKSRCEAVIAAANRNARNYHLSGPVARVGHGILRVADRLRPNAALRHFDWIYGFDPTHEAPAEQTSATR